ncbi:hypothetical protein J7S95_19570 [Providencia stuartii]|uniref:hypothetical protein n=1 Tax=Providencia stuartii TaxID=588 RepID=UPI001B74727A|nr:hypothetical protein [Providencia stuartii]MBQ0458883.1 hypothetical protein [Providencia stuartii]MBQ0458896.1 hypothetical protein [Providencia stuartii]
METEKEEATQSAKKEKFTVKYLIEFFDKYSKKIESEEDEAERTKRALKLKPTTNKKIKRKI